MYFFSKVATSTTAILGTAGLAAYLIPYGLGKSGLSDILFKSSTSTLDIWNLLDLKTEEEKQIKELLTPLFEKFKSSLTYSEGQSQEKYKEIEKLFREVSEFESSLKDIYEKNKENFQELEKVTKELFDLSKEKLKIQAEANGLENLLKLLDNLGKTISSLEKSFSFMVCTLDNKTLTNGTCDDSSTSAQTNGGGGKAQAKQAPKLKKH